MQKKLHGRCSTGLKIGFWLRAWNIELTLVPSIQIKLKKYPARKYVRHRFWKGERSWWDSKQNKCFCWGSLSKAEGSLKKTLWEILHNLQENICAGSSFLVFSCEFCEICKNAFFTEQHRTTAFDYSSINSSDGSIGKRNRKILYKNRLKHTYLFEPEVLSYYKGQSRWKNRFQK